MERQANSANNSAGKFKDNLFGGRDDGERNSIGLVMISRIFATQDECFHEMPSSDGV